MKIVIDIDNDLYTRLFDAGENYVMDMRRVCVAVRKGKVIPCLASDSFGQMWVPCTIVIIDGHCYDGKNFNFDPAEFLKGEEVIIDDQKGYILPREIVAWMPLPEPYKAKKEDKNENNQG